MSERTDRQMKAEFDLNSYRVFSLKYRTPRKIAVRKNQIRTSSNSSLFSFSAPKAQFRHFLDSQYTLYK